MELTNTLLDIKRSLTHFYPEVGIMGGIVLLLFIDLFFKAKHRFLYKYIASAIIIIPLSFSMVQHCPCVFGTGLFSNALLINHTSVLFKILFDLSAIGVILFSIAATPNVDEHENRVEYYVLILGVLLGAHLMAMSYNLLVTFIGVELVSLCSYMLTAINKKNQEGYEGAIKYLIFGAVASALMLYGMSWLYGLYGGLSYDDIKIGDGTTTDWFLIFILFLVLCGFLFKIAAAPMHSWVPDVYQAAPNPIVAYFSVLPKLAGIAIFFNLVLSSDPHLEKMIIVVSLVSICMGNLGAFLQKNVKRMLAYSSIAHAGFLLIAIVSLNEYSQKAALFYGYLLLFTNLGAFFVIHVLSKQMKAKELQDFSGVGKELPIVGVSIAIMMAALTGLPPTMGFSAKLFLFSGLWDTYQTTSDSLILTLFIIGLVNTVFGLFYYIKLPYYMFFKDSSKLPVISLTVTNKFFILLVVIPLLLFFIKSDWLFNLF